MPGGRPMHLDNVMDRLRAGLEGRYTIERQLGRGGMATVYLAFDVKHQRQVALKLLHPEFASVVGPERFLREIDIAATLSNPHILPMYDSGQVDGLLYYVMPYVAGESLQERLDRETQLPIDDAVAITRDIAAGLTYAHDQGLVHRDIKPGNILLDGEDAVLADFGIARAVDVVGGEELTDSGVVIGTPEYMSPEQGQGHGKVDSRSDIYSLGCVLYEMIAGEPPFDGPTAQVIIARHQHEAPRSLTVTRSTVPASVEFAIESALAKVPADRPNTAERFVEMLDEPVPRTREVEVRSSTLRSAGVLVTTAAVVVLGVFAARVLNDSDVPPWLNGRPASVVVMPFRTSTTSQAEQVLADELADEITRELNHWESIRAVPSVSLSGPIFDLGLSGPTFERIDDGIDVTRAVNAQALAALTISLRGDTAFVEASLFDSRTRKSVGQPIQASALVHDVTALVAPIVYGILAIDRADGDPVELRRLTHMPDALSSFIEGQHHLEAWRLTDAAASFRQAIALDTMFASAIHRLAQTLYWEAAQDAGRLEISGPEIGQLSAVSVRLSTGLPSRDSTHIAAFYAFQLGDYTSARELYQSILAMDSTDVYAWLMLGSVEFRDPWLALGSDDSLAPRGNLNTAIRAFAEAVRLQPTFDLGYGHLFDIYKIVTAAIDRGECPGFELPRDEFIAAWGSRTPHQARAFCPVALDSIEWVSRAALDSLDPTLVRAGADRLFDQSVRSMRRWAEFAPGLATPRNEIVTAILVQRGRMGLTSPESIDSMSQVALENASQALALKRDTLPLDLLRLGSLHLGAGNRDEAAALTEEALERYGLAGNSSAESPPSFAANVFLATGQPSRAMRLVVDDSRQVFIKDSLAEALIPYGGAESIISRIRVLGAAGVGGPPLRKEMENLLRTWSPPRYTEHQVRMLRGDATLLIAIALQWNPDLLVEWDDVVEQRHPSWRALVESLRDSTVALSLLHQSLEAKISVVDEAVRSFLLGVTAANIGAHDLAISLFARLDSLPLGLDRVDVGWGLCSLSYLLRAREYEAKRDTSSTVEYYQRFIEAWTRADSLALPLVDEARRGLQRHQRNSQE